MYVTQAEARITCDKNVSVWVSIVSYKKNLRTIIPERIGGGIWDSPTTEYHSQSILIW